MPIPLKARCLKLLLPIVAGAGLILWAGTGCSNREVDIPKLQSAFQSAEPGIRAELDQGIADIKSGDNPAALKVLQHLAFAAKLTKEQRPILLDTIKKIKARIK